jgi:uncharacterized membrane protein
VSVAPPPQTDEFSQEIAKRVGALVGRDKAAAVTAQIVSIVQSERFSGPIAHPKHLREYEEICPGSADRIISMAERNLSHTHKLQETALDGEIKDHRDGRLYGFLALALLIIGAIVAGLMGNTTLAVAFLSAGALGTVGAIIKGARQH